jgi:hypothetical protein
VSLPNDPATILPPTHPANALVRALYAAVGTLDIASVLSLVNSAALEEWQTALRRSPHTVWALQEYREMVEMPVTDLPTTMPECLRYVLEAVGAPERRRVPVIHAVRSNSSGRMWVEFSLAPHGNDDIEHGIDTSRPFVVDVQEDSLRSGKWYVVPLTTGAFPLPGLVSGMMFAVLDTGPDGEELSIEIRLDATTDPVNAVALEQLLRAVGCHVEVNDTHPSGLRALSVVVPATISSTTGLALLQAICAFPVVRQLWRADAGV